MKSRKIKGFLIVILISFVFWASYSVFASAQKDVVEEEQCTKVNLQDENKAVYYKLREAENGESIPVSVYVNKQEVMTLTEVAGGLTPRERAAVIVGKLRDFINNNENPNGIFPGIVDGTAVVKFDEEVLLTADVNNAAALNLNVSDLALSWANNIRKSLGSFELVRDYELVKVLEDNYNENASHYEAGIASWYGEYFHGRTAADGSIYNMYEFTAAHKSLPFGSIVKVKNLRNGKHCIVKITDRGPFIEGRIIDLSVVAAQEIDMYHSGVSEVEIEVIGRV